MNRVPRNRQPLQSIRHDQKNRHICSDPASRRAKVCDFLDWGVATSLCVVMMELGAMERVREVFHEVTRARWRQGG